MRYLVFLGTTIFSLYVSAATQPQFISLKTQFKSFVTKARGQDLDAQIEIWKIEVESAIPEVYLALMQGPKGVDQARHEKAAKWFPFLINHSEKILMQFEEFEKTGWPMAQRLSKNYPQVHFTDVRIIAMPSLMMFNGQVREIDGHFIAMFGMDFLQLIEENPKLIEGADLINNMPILVSHEFTHALHGKVSEFSQDSSATSTLLSPLWEEGLAQVHSQLLAPGTDLTTVLMEKNIALKCNPDQIKKWAFEFLKDGQSRSDTDLESNYTKWFTLNGRKTLGVARAGYCLGYYTILGAMREHSFNELITMNRNDAYIVVQKVLSDISK